MRSSDGQLPGAELHPAIYRWILVAYGWMLFAAWLAFGHSVESDVNLTVAVALAIVFFAIAIILRRVAAARARRRRRTFDEFLSTRVDTASGPLSAREASLQVLLIPIALALAATILGAINLLAG